MEDAIYDSYAMRKFMGLDFLDESVPDAITLCNFRKIIVENGLAQQYFAAVNRFMEEHGHIMRGGNESVSLALCVWKGLSMLT